MIEEKGKVQIISPASDYVFSYDLKGKQIWKSKYPGGYSVVPRPIHSKGIVYVSSGYDRPTLYAIRVDGVGEVKIFEERGKNLYFRVSLPQQYLRYLVDKGCVAVDGCSLTVCEVEQDSFAIWLIPHTIEKTNLKQRRKGDRINLEFDILAKYVENFSGPIVDNKG